VQAPIASVGQPISTSKNSTINYEIDKTIRHVKQSVGTVKRLSAAVVVNQRKEIGKDGKPANKPLPDGELKQISDLVKEAMGFSKDRGDTISVANAPFTVIEKDEGMPLWRDPEMVSLAKDLIKYGVLAGIIAYLLLGVVRPLLKTMLPSPPAEARPPSAARSTCLPRKRAKKPFRSTSRPPPSCSKPSLQARANWHNRTRNW
jgi:flagellar M-ring protein FliF